MPKYVERCGSIDASVVRPRTVIGLLRTILLEVFMPKGYPHSVSADYLHYQIWDTVQAFASSMNGALATEAVLRGAGVGNQNASAMAATIAWLLKDGLGMITRIAFAWLKSPYLDADCKKWRLVADIFNDIAFSVDLIVPMFADFFMPIVCISSILRSIVGVAGVATRTTITNHQAISNNVGDVSAKDASQETLVNVTALVCSLLMLPLVSGRILIVWLLFCVFTVIHLCANYQAVRSLHFRTLNQTLLHIVVRHYVDEGNIHSVEWANEHEPLFLLDRQNRFYGFRASENLKIECDHRLITKNYIVSYDATSKHGYVSISNTGNTRDQLHAAICLEFIALQQKSFDATKLNAFIEMLATAGWSIDSHRLVFDQWTFEEK